MHKLKEMILMLCLILSGALCYASGAAGMEIHALTVTYAGYQWYNQHQME